jgi:hypothetical protein
LRKQVDPDTPEYRQLISDAVRVLEELRTGVGGVFWLDEIIADRKRTGRYNLWAWPSDAEVEEWAYRGTGRAGFNDLDNALADYLKRPWLQHDAIDISAINACLVTELAELALPHWSFIFVGRNVLAQAGLALIGRLIGFLAAWIMLPALAVGLLVRSHETEAIVVFMIWGLYIAYRIIKIPARWRARKLRKKVAECVAAMVKAWHAARGRTINPSRLKELVLTAEERGATFPSVLHTIIDRAIDRDPTALIRRPT